ncbi:MAG: metallophosphoesterase [Proteobacteria bacterium]|nr:metallophosphoesterase [Pseudomonadota bacterium]
MSVLTGDSLTPPDTVIYAVGDIHGRRDLLELITAQIVADAAQRTARRRILVFLGDYLDRGADSRRVIEMMLDPPPEGFERVTLKGNHEDLLLRYLAGELDAGQHWFNFDGQDTLADYGVEIPDPQARDDANMSLLRQRLEVALPQSHLDFFRSLQISYQAGGYYFVHGGVRPGVPLDQQGAHDCMWIRGSFLNSQAEHGAVVVHGHSICEQPELKHNRIGIDTGAYDSGVLTCLVLDGATRSFLQT